MESTKREKCLEVIFSAWTKTEVQGNVSWSLKCSEQTSNNHNSYRYNPSGLCLNYFGNDKIYEKNLLNLIAWLGAM